MKIQDEFIRSPRWTLVFWKQSLRGCEDVVEMVVLLDPFEADIVFRELRLPKCQHLPSPSSVQL